MNKLLTVTRMQLGSALDFIKVFNKRNQKKSVGAVSILLGSFLFFSVIVGMYCMSIGMVLNEAGRIDVLPGFVMAVTCGIVLFTTVYKVKGTIFGFKDYDLVMSLPVKTSTVIASRMLLLYVIDLFFTSIMMFPCIIVYGAIAKPPVYFYILTVISVFFIPLIPMVLAAIIGTLISIITAGFRHSSLMNTIFTIAIVVAIMFGSGSINSSSQISDLGETISDMLQKIYPPAQMYLDGIVNGNILSYLLFIGISVAIFALFSILVGKVFKKMNTAITAVSAKRKFKMSRNDTRSASTAVMKKELKRIFSSTMYLTNTGISLVMMVIAVVALAVAGGESLLNSVFGVEEGLTTSIKSVVPFIFLFFGGMVYTTGCSISLEGNNLWIIKSAPVHASEIFEGKIRAMLVMALPLMVVCEIATSIILKLSAFQTLLTILLPSSFVYFMAVFGLIINLKLPVFDWKNEVLIVKQSAASMICIFGGMIVSMIFIGVGFLCMSFADWITLALSVVLIIAACVLKKGLYNRADDILLKL